MTTVFGWTISKVVWINILWGCNSGWSGHLIPRTGVVARLLHLTPTDNSLYCCGLQTLPHTSGSVTKIQRLLKETCIPATFIDIHFHVEMLLLNYKFLQSLTIRLKARIVRSPEQVYSSPLWICIAFTASWWPSNSPSVGTSSSPGSDISDKTHTNIWVIEWNINSVK